MQQMQMQMQHNNGAANTGGNANNSQPPMLPMQGPPMGDGPPPEMLASYLHHTDGRALHHFVLHDFQYKASLRMEMEGRIAEAIMARARAEADLKELEEDKAALTRTVASLTGDVQALEPFKQSLAELQARAGQAGSVDAVRCAALEKENQALKVKTASPPSTGKH